MTSCPTGDELRDWLGELLPDPQCEILAVHVDNCDACQATLDSLLVDTDLVGGRQHRGTPLPDEPAHDREFLRKLQATTSPICGAEAAGQLTPFACEPDSGPSPRPNVPGYEVLEQIGRGGMGIVYKARHLELNRLVALKLLHAARRLESDDRLRLRTEAEAAARLRHPDIVQIHDTGECDGGPYLAMELVPGGQSGGVRSRGPATGARVRGTRRTARPRHSLRARARRHSPRPQTREYLAGRRAATTQDRGLRTGTLAGQGPRPDADWGDPGNPVVHGARTLRSGSRRPGTSRRHLWPGSSPL